MKKGFKLTMEKREKLEGLFFVSPFLIGLAVFFAYPLFLSVKLSFGKVTNIVGFKIKLVGMENYVRAFLVDTNFIPMFLEVVQKTLTEAPLIIIMALLIAILINKDIKGRGFFRVVFFIPFLLGTGEVMNQLLSQGVDKAVLSITDGKLIPYEVFAYFGSTVIEVVDNVFGTLVQVLWSSGVQILLFLSGLQGISESLYESAKVDGATEWEIFWKITWPMMAPTTFLCIVYTLVDSFTKIKNPILKYIQEYAFKKTQFEYAAAMGWIYFVFIILLVLLVNLVMSKYINALNYGGGKKRESK